MFVYSRDWLQSYVFRKNNETLKMQLSEELIVKNKGATLAMSIAPFLVLEFLSFLGALPQACSLDYLFQ
jgi:hypothetical protein